MRCFGFCVTFLVGVILAVERGFWERAFERGDFNGLAAITEGYEKALALLLAGRTGDVIKLLEGREDCISLRLYGFAACAEGRWARALEAADKLLRTVPDDPEALAIKAEALIGLGDESGAAPLLQKIPATMSAYARFRAALLCGDTKGATSAAQELARTTGYKDWMKISPPK